MPRKKSNLEKVEAIDRSTMAQPPFVMANEILFFQDLRQRVLAAIANKSGVVKSIAPELRQDDKTEGRIEIETMICRIADRIKNAPPLPVPPLVLTYAAPEQVQDVPGAHAEGESVSDVPLHVLLRDLMKKAARR